MTLSCFTADTPVLPFVDLLSFPKSIPAGCNRFIARPIYAPPFVNSKAEAEVDRVRSKKADTREIRLRFENR